MFLYIVLSALAGIIVGAVYAIRTKKQEGLTYGKLDKAGRITNVLLSIVYVCISPLYLFLGALCRPAHDGLLGILGWIVSIIAASAAMICALGIGFSIAWRKQGKSKKSFAVQFAGFAGIALTLLIFFVFYGNLLATLN